MSRRSSLLGLKRAMVFDGVFKRAPVVGFLAARGERTRVLKVPNFLINTLSPRWSDRMMESSTHSSTILASRRVSSHSSAIRPISWVRVISGATLHSASILEYREHSPCQSPESTLYRAARVG